MEKAVYITGSGIISAIGVGKEATLQSLREHRTGVAKLQYLNTIHTHLPAGEVKMSDEDMREHLHLDGSVQTNRTSLMGSMALQEALADAGLSHEQCADATFISGTTVGGMDYTERHFLEMMESDEHLALLNTHDCGSTSQAMVDALGLRVARILTPSTACSSATNAIIMGCNLIKTGRADIVIAGGSESLSKFHYNGFNTLMILDDQQCRPFDATRKGLNLGEGAAFLVLESEASVRRRGVTPHFQVDGYGNACDAFHQTASSDNGEGAYRAMSEALTMAGLRPEDIDYVNAHGTGTPNNDVSESAALMRVFGEQMSPVSSTKSFTGHTTSASGSVESVICMLAMEHSFLPENLGWKNAMPDGITPTTGGTGVELQHVMCNGFGFGGNDSSVILSKVDASTHADAEDCSKKIYVRSVCTHRPTDEAIDVSQFVPKLEARRMCRLLKTAIYTSMTALKDAGLQSPDGIISSTKYGMLDNSEKFLTQMCAEGEELLKPTLFMQSTHNTIGGMLGIRTKCHGYNITFSNGEKSLRDAILDARLQLELGRLGTVLVGYYDELTPGFAQMSERLHHHPFEVGEFAVSMVLTTNPEGAVCELDDFDLSEWDAIMSRV